MSRKPLISTAMLSLMARPDHHAWTLEDFQAGLAECAVTADFSTVFRAAKKLVAEGAAAKLVFDDGRARFELAGAHHDHLLCTRCDRLVAVPCMIGQEVFAELEAELGVAVTEHRVVLSGLCSPCRALETVGP
jgi:Fur family ferric uptake transcriptional regulator